MKLPLSSFCRGLFLTAFALVAFTAASAASSFEGQVHMDMTAGKKKDKIGITYTMKNGLLRMDMQMPEEHRGRSGGMGGMIFDMEAKEIIVLMDANGRKMFMRRPIPQPTPEQMAKGRENGHSVSPPVATGRTEMIAGYKATEYKMTTEKGETIEMWLAKGLGVFMPFSGGNPMAGGRGAAPAGWETFVRDGNNFPMRMTMHDQDGTEKMHMEVTSVEKGPVDDSLFSTEGYTEFQMPSFGGGFNPFKKD